MGRRAALVQSKSPREERESVMAHTPGPWRSDHEGGFIVLNGSHAYSIRDICSDDRGWNAGDLDLMAAAPDLLAALKDALDVMGDWGDDGDPAWAIRARDAIAKAEGRTDDQ